jgi:hypothetical protein
LEFYEALECLTRDSFGIYYLVERENKYLYYNLIDGKYETKSLDGDFVFREAMAYVFLPSQTLIVTGGATSTYFDDTIELTPATGRVANHPSMNNKRCGHAM